MSKPTLDCQTCGEVIAVLTPAENQRVAHNPQNYIVDCARCKRDRAALEAAKETER